MKKLSLATAVVASLFAFNANAYQYEVNAGYENTSIDDTDADVDSFAISGKYYLNPVQQKGAPLAEAAFLDKASNIGLGYSYSKLSNTVPYAANELFIGSPAVNASAKYELSSFGISGEFFIPDTQFYVAGALNKNENETTVSAVGISASEGSDHTGYALEAGYLPVDGLLLALGVSKENLDPTFAANNGFITTINYGNTVGSDTTVTARGKYVTQIGGFYTNFEGAAYFGDETAYKLGADLYLDSTLSVGVSFADSTADESDTIFNVRAQKFLTEQVAVGVGYTTTDGADSYGINGTFRF